MVSALKRVAEATAGEALTLVEEYSRESLFLNEN
jgi:hypothetical protein